MSEKTTQKDSVTEPNTKKPNETIKEHEDKEVSSIEGSAMKSNTRGGSFPSP